jgi:hypothetical protein
MVRTERRNLAAREVLLRRIRAEFEEMPGLALTVRQGMKLFGLGGDATARILGRLVATGWLCRTPDCRYVRRLDEL